MYRRAIDTDGKSLSICVLESIELRFQRRQFKASSGSEVEGIEEQEQMFSASKLLESDLAAKLVAKGKGWGFRSDFNHG